MKIEILMNNEELYNNIFGLTSSYNLGVAISSLAIIVAFIEIVSLKNNLKIKLYSDYKKIALYLAFFSIGLTFITEFFRNIYINIIAAILMVLSISIYIWLIAPIKKISEKRIKKVRNVLNGFLPNKYSHSNSEIIKDIIDIFDTLLTLSLKSKEVGELFIRYFTSKVFLEYFSKSGYIFSNTLLFLSKNNSRQVEYFFEQLFLISLDNQDSYLNIFLKEEIYQNTIDDFDILMLEKPYLVYSLLQRSRFDFGYHLTLNGQISFLKVIERYFRLVGWFNECKNYPKKDDCKIKYLLSDDLVKLFFDSIVEILDSTYKYTEKEKKELLDSISFHSYNYCMKVDKKSEGIRRYAGKLLYEISEKLLLNYNFYDKKKNTNDSFIIRGFYDNLINRGKDKIAQQEFLDEMKEKIISDKFSSNLRGWYPAMILVYWQLFGFSIFTGNPSQNEPEEIHIEILSKLAESFPKLYDGNIRHLYDEKLPKGKEDYYIKKGRGILNDFLLEYMEYNREENSLSYYFHFGDSPDAKKIFLDKVKKNKKIHAFDI